MSTEKIYAEHTASISEAKANPNRLLKEAGGGPVAVLSHNKPRYYLVPREMYEQLIEKLERLESNPNKRRKLTGQFRPGKMRLETITRKGKEALKEASEKELGDFVES